MPTFPAHFSFFQTYTWFPSDCIISFCVIKTSSKIGVPIIIQNIIRHQINHQKIQAVAGVKISTTHSTRPSPFFKGVQWLTNFFILGPKNT